MIRIGMSLYLILATLAGPWFCCCAAARWVGSFAAAEAKPAAARSCCHGKVETDPASTKTQDRSAPEQDKSPSKPHSPCPCDHGNKDVKIPADSQADLRGFQASVEWNHLSSFSVTLYDQSLHFTPESVGIASEPIAFPYAHGRDILRILSAMRC